MPAGTNTGPNDALTAARVSMNAIDHLMETDGEKMFLKSTLQRSGVSFDGAQQFSQGLAVTNPADRRTLAAILTVLLKGL